MSTPPAGRTAAQETFEEEPDPRVQALQHKIEEYERWFRLLDAQMRVLDRERQKLSAVLNHTDAGFLVLDASLTVVWANQVYTRRFGAGAHPGAVVGQACHRILCRREAPCERCPAQQPFRSGGPAHDELVLELQGQRRYIYTTAMPIKSPEGRIEETMVMVQDVSDLEVLRRTADALRASEERFRSIFEKSGAGMATAAADGSFLQVNPALCAFLGYEEAELLRRTVFDVTHPEDLERTRRIYEDVAAGTLSEANVEKRYRRRDGQTVWGRTTATWLRDSNGSPAYSIALVQDVTVSKRAEEALRHSEARKGAILETALDAVVTIDAAGCIVEFNPTAERMFGVRREEAIGREAATMLMPAALREAHRRGLARRAEGGEALAPGRRMETTAVRADGTEFPVEVAVSRIPASGSPVFTGFIRDLTERRRLEEELRQAEKMSAVGLLVSGVAHELNNPLAGVLGYAQLLLKDDADEKVRRGLESIQREAERCKRIVQNLQSFARRHKPQEDHVGVNGILESTLELRAYQLKVDDIAVTFDLDPDLPKTMADFHQLRQVFLNIIVNAHQALVARGGPGSLLLRTRRRGETIVVEIEDDGPGIAVDHVSRVFDPFFTTKEVGQGTGLGLSICYGIVKEHGGNISARNTPGGGAQFTVELPVRSPSPSRAAPAGEPGGPEGAPRGLNILVVDDEPAILEILHDVLSLDGHRVDTALSGAAALRKLERESYDVVICDLKMPGMTGQEVYEKVRSMDVERARRIVFSTGDTASLETHDFLERTGNLYLQKPFSLEAIRGLVASLAAVDAPPTRR